VCQHKYWKRFRYFSIDIFDNTKLHLVYYFRCLFKRLQLKNVYIIYKIKPATALHATAEIHKHLAGWRCVCRCVLVYMVYEDTHTCICGLRGLSIDVIVFMLYKLYILSPYTTPTPKSTHHRKLSATTFSMFFKPFGL